CSIGQKSQNSLVVGEHRQTRAVLSNFLSLAPTEFSASKVSAASTFDGEIIGCPTTETIVLTEITKKKAFLQEYLNVQCEDQRYFNSLTEGEVMRGVP